jgi:hypothetical protein
MSLKPCSDCGRYISRDAHACPYCGRSILHLWEVLTGLLALILLVVVGGAIVYGARDPAGMRHLLDSVTLFFRQSVF